jgi:hypothetical protein
MPLLLIKNLFSNLFILPLLIAKGKADSKGGPRAEAEEVNPIQSWRKS